jgi:hypothetical protein
VTPLLFLCISNEEHLLADNRLGWTLTFRLKEPKAIDGSEPELQWTVDEKTEAAKYKVGAHYDAELLPRSR